MKCRSCKTSIMHKDHKVSFTNSHLHFSRKVHRMLTMEELVLLLLVNYHLVSSSKWRITEIWYLLIQKQHNIVSQSHARLDLKRPLIWKWAEQIKIWCRLRTWTAHNLCFQYHRCHSRSWDLINTWCCRWAKAETNTKISTSYSIWARMPSQFNITQVRSSFKFQSRCLPRSRRNLVTWRLSYLKTTT